MKKLVTLIVFFSTGLAWAQDAEADLKAMQGTWLVASLVEKGKAVPAAEIDVLEVIIDKDVFTVNEKGKTIAQYQVKIDASKTPRAIDLKHLVGEDKGKTEPGIYAIEKDQIKFCLDEDKKGRPGTFEGKDYSVLTLKKKPAKS